MARIPIVATLSEGTRFAVANGGWIMGAAFLPVVGSEIANFIYTNTDQNLGLAEPGTDLARWIWIPVFATYLGVAGFLTALASAIVAERAFGRSASLYQLVFSRRVWRLFVATYFTWGVAYGVVFLLQEVTKLLFVIGLSIDTDGAIIVMASAWFGAAQWFLTTILMMLVFARMGFFIVPVAMAEGTEVLRRSWHLVHGNLWQILAIFAAVEGPFLIAYSLMPLPFHGTWGFGTDSIFQNGAMISPPLLDPAAEFLKYIVEGIFVLMETALVVGVTIAAYRALSPAHAFD